MFSSTRWYTKVVCQCEKQMRTFFFLIWFQQKAWRNVIKQCFFSCECLKNLSVHCLTRFQSSGQESGKMPNLKIIVIKSKHLDSICKLLKWVNRLTGFLVRSSHVEWFFPYSYRQGWRRARWFKGHLVHTKPWALSPAPEQNTNKNKKERLEGREEWKEEGGCWCGNGYVSLLQWKLYPLRLLK